MNSASRFKTRPRDCARWHVAEESNGKSNMLIIYKGDKQGSVQFSAVEVNDVSKDNGKPAEETARMWIEGLKKFREVLSAPDVEGKIDTPNSVRIKQKHEGVDFIEHHITYGVNAEDELHILYFQAPESDWNKEKITGLTILESFPLGSLTSASPVKLSDAIDTGSQEAKKINGDANLFTELTKPMAPLDLNIRISMNSNDASSNKNFFYGQMGAAAGLAEGFHEPLLKRFFAQYQGKEAVERASEKLPGLNILIKQMDAQPEIQILSTWSDGEYRVNDVIITKSAVVEYDCGTIYFPCSKRTVFTPETITTQTRQLLDLAKPLVEHMRKLGFVAIVKNELGYRAILDGLSDNEVGLFIPSSTNKNAELLLPDGKDVAIKAKISDSAIFYGAN